MRRPASGIADMPLEVFDVDQHGTWIKRGPRSAYVTRRQVANLRDRINTNATGTAWHQQVPITHSDLAVILDAIDAGGTR